jgi:hypothetical protein
MSFHDLLVRRVCVKKSVILMDLPLYVTCLFSFAAFSILSLFCMFESFDYDIPGEYFFFGPNSLLFCKLPAPG